MSNIIDDMQDDEIRPISSCETSSSTIQKTELPKSEPALEISQKQNHGRSKLLPVITIALMVVVAVALFVILKPNHENDPEADSMAVGIEVNEAEPASEIEVKQVTVDKVPLQVISVDNLVPTLHVGSVDTTDLSIRVVLQAADWRADNGEIVGDFVLRGKLLSQGTSKQGYCEINDNQLTIGNSEESGCKQCAIDQQGYFFRQYLLVSNGTPMPMRPKGSHLRRALCMTEDGKLSLIFSQAELTFDEFAKVLSHVPVSQAIYLTGGSAYGFYRSLDGAIHHFGYPCQVTDKENVNYIIFR